MWLIVLLQLAVPLVLMGLIAFMPHPTRLNWWANVLAFGMVIAFLWMAARWDIVSMHLRVVLPFLFLLAVVLGYRRFRPPESRPGKFKIIFGVMISAALVVLMSGFLWHTLTGYVEPEGAIDLRSPLREGRYVVLHGGASPFINGHYHVRPQNHALDMLGLNAWGGRASVLGDMRDLDSYEIFRAKLFSPCDGRVLVAVDRFEDQVPPSTDTENLAGNHVVVACKGVEVLLAHMRQGSIKVAAGDSVTTETELGEVGNTGNTSEPHLHLHAERDGPPGVILDGKAVPVTIDGRSLVRGEIVKER